MILNFEQNSDLLWSDVHLIKNKLSQLSHLSLLDSQKEKDRYQEKFLTYVFELNLDSLNGGYYKCVKGSAELSLSDNLYLADLLFAASQTFFNGEISYRLNSIIKALIECLYSIGNGAFYSEICFKNGTAPFVFNGQILVEQLSQQELALLRALLDRKKIVTNDNYWVSYKTNLIQASNNIGIHIKQAQILEESLQQKLKESIKVKYSDAKIDKTIEVSQNCHALSLLVSLTLQDRDPVYEEFVEAIKNYVLKCLDGDALDVDTLINCCYALIDYCQFCFNKDIIELVFNQLKTLDIVLLKSDKSKVQFSIVCKVINKLLGKDSLNNNFVVASVDISSLEIHILTGRRVGLESRRQELLSSYNPNIKIFIMTSTQTLTLP
jgi:hypothetical protein